MRWYGCWALALGAMLGCGEDPAPAPPGARPGAVEYYGLAVGTRWEYRQTAYDAKGIWAWERTRVKEVVACEEIDWIDCSTGETHTRQVYVRHTTNGSGAEPGLEAGTHYLEAHEDGVVRLRADYIFEDAVHHFVTYSPYFMRIPNGPYTDATEWDTVLRRCEYGRDGTLSRTSERRHIRWVVDPTDGITVEAGTFGDVLHVRRMDRGDNSVQDSWYALGVGEVLEETRSVTGALEGIEELLAHSLGDGTCPE